MFSSRKLVEVRRGEDGSMAAKHPTATKDLAAMALYLLITHPGRRDCFMWVGHVVFMLPLVPGWDNYRRLPVLFRDERCIHHSRAFALASLSAGKVRVAKNNTNCFLSGGVASMVNAIRALGNVFPHPILILVIDVWHTWRLSFFYSQKLRKKRLLASCLFCRYML